MPTPYPLPGGAYCSKRIRSFAAHPFDPGSLRASSAGARPQKIVHPLLGGGRGRALPHA